MDWVKCEQDFNVLIRKDPEYSTQRSLQFQKLTEEKLKRDQEIEERERKRQIKRKEKE